MLIAPTQDRFTALQTILYGLFEKKTVYLYTVNSTTIEQASDETALAIATSGSQAEPKIIHLSWKNIFCHCQNFVKIIPIDASSIWLNCMPLNHIAGVMIIYRCWFNHASMILHHKFCAEQVWQDINCRAVSHISLVPRMLFKLLELSQNCPPPASLKYVLVGGDSMPDALYQQAKSAGWPIYISYGMTEASSTIAIGQTPDKLKILEGFSVKLTEEAVLKIKGDMVMTEANWFITHDRVTLDHNYLSIIGRNDYMIISGGNNVAPETIESMLISTQAASEFFKDIAIGKIPNLSWGDTIVAVFCGQSSKKLESWINQNIASAYKPRHFIQVTAIPRNCLGKIDRKAVQSIIDRTVNLSKAINLSLY